MNRLFTRRLRKRCPPRAGFTLIELLVVIVLIALVMGAAIFTVSRVSPTERVKAAAVQLGSDIDKLRSRAAISGKKYGVLYDLDNNRYALLVPRKVDSEDDAQRIRDLRKEDDGEVLRIQAWKDFPDFLSSGRYTVRLTEVVLSDQERFTSGQVRIDISPTGLTSGHFVRLAATDAPDSAFTVEINPVSGLVSYREGNPEFDLVDDMDITE